MTKQKPSTYILLGVRFRSVSGNAEKGTSRNACSMASLPHAESNSHISARTWIRGRVAEVARNAAAANVQISQEISQEAEAEKVKFFRGGNSASGFSALWNQKKTVWF